MRRPGESLPQRCEIGSKKSARVRRLTPGALAICENTIRLQRHSWEIVMGSGAYAVFIDQQAPGGGPPGSLRRVVPLPPPELSGGVKFTTVVLRSEERRVGNECISWGS